MDEMTDYEFEYEFLQDAAYRQMIDDFANNAKIDPTSNTLDRSFSMDEAEYQHIVELSEKNEYIDFEIPKDAPMGKLYSQSLQESVADEDEFVPVNMEQEFGGDLSG